MPDTDEKQKQGWRDGGGRTLEELLDWGKMEPPAKGFGKNMGKVLQAKGRSLPQPANKGIPRVIRRVPEENTHKLYIKEDLQIPINGFRKGEDKLIEAALDKVPSYHLRDLKAVDVVNNPLIVIRKDKPMLARADYDPLTAKIEVNRKLVELNPRKKLIESESKETLLHEIGHHFYVRNVSEPLRQEFKDIASREKLLLFKDKYFDDVEFFAGAYTKWHEQRKALAKKYPSVYNILKRIFEVANEAQNH